MKASSSMEVTDAGMVMVVMPRGSSAPSAMERSSVVSSPIGSYGPSVDMAYEFESAAASLEMSFWEAA